MGIPHPKTIAQEIKNIKQQENEQLRAEVESLKQTIAVKIIERDDARNRISDIRHRYDLAISKAREMVHAAADGEHDGRLEEERDQALAIVAAVREYCEKELGGISVIKILDILDP